MKRQWTLTAFSEHVRNKRLQHARVDDDQDQDDIIDSDCSEDQDNSIDSGNKELNEEERSKDQDDTIDSDNKDLNEEERVQSFKPEIWSHDQLKSHLTRRPWLKVRSDTALLCKTCISYGRVPLDTRKGMRPPKEWTEIGIFASGATKQDKLTNLRHKLSRHEKSAVHKASVDIVYTAKQDVLCSNIRAANKVQETSTGRVFRAAYYLAKNNRPYTDHVELCQLMELSGVSLGVILRSRLSATEIISSIAHDMRKSLCTAIIESGLKVAITLDESTTVSHKSAVILYLRTVLPETTTPVAFPLELVELSSLTAECIFEKVLSCLNKNGFSNEYLESNLIGVCSDGASTMIGKQSGVLTRFKDVFPQLILWHCMCHRIELAVADAVKDVKAVNHVKSFLDKLYSLYSQSPKAKRELESCAEALGIQLKRIGRVLGTRWAASSYLSVNAVWTSYEALYKHFSDNAVDSNISSTKRASYKGLRNVLGSYEFVHSLAILHDVLEEVSILSKALQGESIDLGQAYRVLSRTIRALEQQKTVPGKCFVLVSELDSNRQFRGINLSSQKNQLCIPQQQFLQSLIDNLSSRLDCAVASNRSAGGQSNDEDLKLLLDQIDCLNPTKWPSSIQSPWIEGETRLRLLCRRFNIEFAATREEYRDFIDDPNSMPPLIKNLRNLLHTIPVSSADCERGFSTMNLVISDLRNRLTIRHASDLLFISLVGPPQSEFDPTKYVSNWLLHHRSADDTRSKRASVTVKERYRDLWRLL